MKTLDTAKELDSPLTVGEIIVAMRINLAVRADSLLNSLKEIQDKLSPLLLVVYKESLHHGTLPYSNASLSRSHLKKKDRSCKDLNPYRPLLNKCGC